MKCLFCEIADPRQQQHLMPEDHVLAATDDFYAKPALGQFVEGYVLLITRQHHRTLAEIPPNDFVKLDRFKDYLTSILSRIYRSPILAFEHGCTNAQHRAGSCIDHAHMHLLPSRTDFAEYLKAQFPFETLRSSSDLRMYSAREISYLYYEFIPGEKLVFQVETDLPGQYLRRLVCEASGAPDIWDWAAHPFRDRIRSFARAYAAATIPRWSDLHQSPLSMR